MADLKKQRRQAQEVFERAESLRLELAEALNERTEAYGLLASALMATIRKQMPRLPLQMSDDNRYIVWHSKLKQYESGRKIANCGPAMERAERAPGATLLRIISPFEYGLWTTTRCRNGRQEMCKAGTWRIPEAACRWFVKSVREHKGRKRRT